MRKRRSWPAPFLLTLALAAGPLGAGCGSSPTTPGDPDPKPDPDPDPVPAPGLLVEAAGRPERGLRLYLTLSDTTTAGAETDGTAPAWSADPADAVEFITITDGKTDAEGGSSTGGSNTDTGAGAGKVLGAVEVHLLRAGPVKITGTAGELSGRLTLEIAAPPTVVFEMVRDGNRDIFRAALDGGDLVRLTSGKHDNRSPTAAGDRVVFVSYRDGNGELYSVPLAGGTEIRLTSTGAHEADPALSPDGKRLAYMNTATGVPKLWTATANASGAARAAPDFGFAGSLEASPAWAPGGDRLVFVSTTRGTADLFLYTPATGAVELLLGTDAPEVEPAWSPDGEWVAFTSARAGQTDLYRVRIATGEVEQLTDRAETDARPAWLGDGRLVYVARVEGATRLRWLHPAEPDVVYEVPVGEGTIGRVAGVW